MKKKESQRKNKISEKKRAHVENLVKKMLKSKTILIASTKGLPASQYQTIKKKLREKAELVVVRKTLLERAINETKKEKLQELKEFLTSDIVIIFSDTDCFSLASELIDGQINIKAKAGDIAPEDITIEPGPTELAPGPAISELSSVGLKVMVEGGKIAIKQQATIVKKGETINEKIASILGKLKIEPMKTGLIPIVAYDSKDNLIYKEIKIDKKLALEELKDSARKALNLAIKLFYPTKETIPFLIAKANREEMVLEKIINEKAT